MAGIKRVSTSQAVSDAMNELARLRDENRRLKQREATVLELKNKHEAFLLMACIEGKHDAIIKMLEADDLRYGDDGKIGIIEGLNREYAELQDLHHRIEVMVPELPKP